VPTASSPTQPVIAGVTALGLIMAVLDTTIVNVALDRLSRDLHSSLTSIE
jgi:hypothetical protein